MTSTPLGAAQVSAPSSDLDPFSDEFLTDPYPGHTELREAGRWCG